jgi:hypothetical protein
LRLFTAMGILVTNPYIFCPECSLQIRTRLDSGTGENASGKV